MTTAFSQINKILHYVGDHCDGILNLMKVLPLPVCLSVCVCVSPGLCLLQVWRAADPQVTAARLPRHAGPRDRLV